MSYLHINTGGGIWPIRELFTCPVCKVENARIVINHFGNPYYGPKVTCAECGDSWSDGELMERPFRRGWRKEAQAQALADWNAAPQLGTKVQRDHDLYVIGYRFPWEAAA